MSTAILNQADVLRALAARNVQAIPNAKRSYWIPTIALIAIAIAGVSAKYSTTFATVPPPVNADEALSNPRVSVAYPARPQKDLEIQLPAEADPYQTTTLYARIRGFLLRWNVDRGEHVKAGQVLALIDAPEFDQQLLQAEADLNQGIAQLQQSKTERDQAVANVGSAKAQVERADANLKLAQTTALRFKDLVEKWAASQQQYDETMTTVDTTRATVSAAKADVLSKEAATATSESAIKTAEAHVNSLKANLRRLKEMEAFKSIVAPFDGTITRRFLDVGALVPDDGSKPLFTIIQDDTLRIQVNVPQTYALQMKEGHTARVIVGELPNGDFKAKIARTARAIDPASRTLAVELELANKNRAVISGAFVQVKFQLSSDAQPLAIPTSTLKLSKLGPQVALVGADGRIHFQSITLGRDYGATIEALTGLKDNDALVINPAESLTEGLRVDMVNSKTVAAK